MARRARTSRAHAHVAPTPLPVPEPAPVTSEHDEDEVEQDIEDDVEQNVDDEMATAVNALVLDSTAATTSGSPRRRNRPPKPFPFLDLPTEIRLKIYSNFFDDGPSRVVDLEPDNYRKIHKKLALLRTCRTIYSEAAHVYYSTHTFRIFPTYPGRFFKTKKPLLARMTPGQRNNLTKLELRLGPGWSKPPRGWVVNEALGLADCVNVRKLTVLVECDPGDAYFNGFRQADGFYEGFCQNLLEQILHQLPSLKRVHFDAWSSVQRSGPMMSGLIGTASRHGRKICWGPERGWTDDDEPTLGTHVAEATTLLNGIGLNVVVVG